MRNTNPNPTGLCLCGCGQRTTIAAYTARRDGMVKGEPMRYINGHVRRVGLPVLSRFWSQVEKTSGCWNWTGALNTHGYGHIRVHSKWAATHRFSWQLTNGLIPDGLSVLHHCDNRRCVNPKHLFLGTALDNVRDMHAKGRDRHSRARGVA